MRTRIYRPFRKTYSSTLTRIYSKTRWKVGKSIRRLIRRGIYLNNWRNHL